MQVKEKAEYTPIVSTRSSQSAAKAEIPPPKPRSPSERKSVDEASIRQRAYEIYAEGGFQDGNAEDD
jgi:hypothetical protein